MEIYRNFEINDTDENIEKALMNFKIACPEKWKLQKNPKELDNKYIIYKCKLPSRVVIIVYLIREKNTLKVANILPDERRSLSMQEYNEALMKFVKDFSAINPQYSDKVSTNIFDPLKIMSESALDKLKNFYILANKSTGSSHPDDEKRWFSFICQTVEDNRIITDEQEFIDFLLDKEYWKTETFNEDVAVELVFEYSKIARCLSFYINKNRG